MLSIALVGGIAASLAGCAAPGEPENTAVQEVAPPPPANLTAVPTSSQTIQLQWDPVPGASFYVILKGMSPGSETVYTSNSPATATTFLDDHDLPGTQYCFEVVVFVDGSGASGPSNEACATTLGGPQPPNGVIAVATSSSTIDVSWNAVPGALGYYVLESVSGGPFNLIGSVAAPGTAFPANGLQSATTYSFEIESVVAGNIVSGPSLPATATTFGAGLEAYYRLDEKTGASALDSSGNGRTATIGGGAVLTTVDQAPLKDAQEHNPSSVSLATPTSNITAPGVVHFGAGGSALSMWVKLTTAPSGTISLIGRRAPGCGGISWELDDGPGGLSFTGETTASFGQGLPVGTWTHVGVVNQDTALTMYINGQPVATSSFAVGSVVAPSIQIGATGGCANSGGLLVDEVKLYSRALTADEMAALGTRPPAPVNLVTTETHSTFVKFKWDAVPGAEEYLVYRGTGGPGSEVFFTSNLTTTFTGDHLVPNQTTVWKVVALRGGLMSEQSAELSIKTNGPPPPPAGLTVTLDNCCTPPRADLAWNAVPQTIAYHVYQSLSVTGPFIQIATVPPSLTSFQVANLQSKQTYFFKVDDQDDGFTFSAPSAAVSITMP